MQYIVNLLECVCAISDRKTVKTCNKIKEKQSKH